MRHEQPLAPGGRAVIGDLLRAPPGARFDAAVATTYTLDIETALIAPVSLALQAAETRAEALQSPLALLEGLERSLGRLAIFCEGGRIQAAPTPQPRLAALLDNLIVEAAAPGGGAFHPKLWLVRYRRESGAPVLRLLLLSRNLTRDASWDLCLALDGEVGEEPDGAAAPVADLVAALPDMALAPPSPRSRALAADLAADCRRARWDAPHPFEEIAFAVNGLGGAAWRPSPGAKVAVIAPFCDAAALTALAPARSEARLVSRADALAGLPGDMLARFARVQILDEAAESEDGEEPGENRLAGLHAKCFIVEKGWRSSITVGSGNATAPALLNGRNVEVFATLTGKRSAVGSVDELLGDDGFGSVLCDYEPAEIVAPDPAIETAERRLDDARRSLARSGLRMRCGPVDWEAGTLEPSVSFDRPTGPLSGLAAEIWPIGLGEAHRRDAADLLAGAAAPLAPIALRDLSRFIAFRLVDGETGLKTLFSLGAVVDDMPEDRDAAVLRAIVDSRAAFLRYLQLILAEGEDPFAAARGLVRGSAGAGRADREETPLLEAMVRALISDDDRLDEVARLVRRLTAKGDEAPVIPPEFLELWRAFQAARLSRRAAE